MRADPACLLWSAGTRRSVGISVLSCCSHCVGENLWPVHAAPVPHFPGSSALSQCLSLRCVRGHGISRDSAPPGLTLPVPVLTLPSPALVLPSPALILLCLALMLPCPAPMMLSPAQAGPSSPAPDPVLSYPGPSPPARGFDLTRHVPQEFVGLTSRLRAAPP